MYNTLLATIGSHCHADTSLLITSMTELDQTEQAARELVQESVSFAVGEHLMMNLRQK